MLRQLECLVQPAVLLLEHGTETLATSIHSLLQVHPNPYPNPNLNPRPSPNPSPSPKPSPTQAQHPHIVRLHGVVTNDPTSLSLLMGLSPIGSLRTLLDQVSFRVRGRLT